MKIKVLFIYFIIIYSFAGLAMCFPVLERNTKFLNAIDSFKAQEFDTALVTLTELENDGYGDSKPFLYFMLGKVWKELARVTEGSESNEDYEKALNYFKKYRDSVDENSDEYKSALVSIGYVCLQLEQFDQAIVDLEKYLSFKPDDGDCLVCKAYLCNGRGFFEFKGKNFGPAISDFETAYGIRRWPMFGHNLIVGYLAVANKKNCRNAWRVFEEIKESYKNYSKEKYDSTLGMLKWQYEECEPPSQKALKSK